jgi:hypothetical protein
MVNIERKNSINQQTKTKSLAQKYFFWLQPCEIWCLLRKKTRFNSTFYDCRGLVDNLFLKILSTELGNMLTKKHLHRRNHFPKENFTENILSLPLIKYLYNHRRRKLEAG